MSKKKTYIISFAVIIPGIILIAGMLFNGRNKNEADGPVYKVKRGPLTISFVESGTIKARDQVILKSEIEGRTSITYVIPEGTRVKKDDLLVELDVSSLKDQKIDQEIAVQNAEAAYVSATENLAVVENQAKSDVDLAKLTLDFSKQDLEKYLKGEHPYELDQANADITIAEEELTRADDTYTWSQKLFAEKYIPETELKGDELAKKKSELNVELAKKSKDLLTDYTYKRNLAKLQSDVSQAEMAMERTERKANADVIQAKAELKAKEAEFGRQKDKLAKVDDQISKTKIYAPEDGLVIYASSAKNTGFHNATEPLDVGIEVQERQELIYLPTGNASNAEVMIHEFNLKKTAKEQPVIITVDALQGKTLFGTIKTIAPLPDARSMFMNPDLKLYNTVIYVEGEDPLLKTGMSCQAEIIVKKYEDAVYVPLQAVTKIGADFIIYVKSGKTFQPKQVKIGLDNNKVIHILEGLKEGETILLNPPLKSTGGLSQNRSMSEQNGDGNIDAMQEKITQGLKNVEDSQNSQDSDQQTMNTESPNTEKMKKQFENLTPEQQEEMKKKFEQASPEEKEQMRQRQSDRKRSRTEESQ